VINENNLNFISNETTSLAVQTQVGPVAILELEKWGALRGQEKCSGININVFLTW